MSGLQERVGGREWRADVLIIGGGPAGTWAAISAAARGASVVLADKGYCGASGATAPSGTAVWYVEPDARKREAAKASRYARGGYLAETAWMDRVLAQTYSNMQTLADWGYPFPLDSAGEQRRMSLQGPEYMRLMRKRVKQAGVRILDHSPALQLLTDPDGRVSGATGISRQKHQAWRVEAAAVVIATGGCAFLSRALGCNVLTGDGHLMAAEAGAQFSGMEFSNAYGLCPAFASVTKSAFYQWANFYHGDGRLMQGAGSAQGRSVIAKVLQSEAVYARLDKADALAQAQMRLAQPNFFLPFDRLGIDPFSQLFPVTLRLEGTVRGTGGLRIVDEQCATSVPGLFAAGDAATRELICGGFTGGGSHNAAWALSSGFWAGAGAAQFAQGNRLSGGIHLREQGGAGLLDARGRQLDPGALIKAVQDEVFPYQRNWFRRGDELQASLGRLDTLWQQVRTAAPASDSEQTLRLREASAMLAVSRWMYRSALARTESRGMHRRSDYTRLDTTQRHRVLSGGLDEVWTAHQSLAPVDEQLLAEQAA
ncbi:FAD-dependent oxidoreductase [Pseudomonas gingeri]|uniref:FAD-dependent oxidoreductase n=1 Tax=Pseudomonas gingeri TaxID=117681 RepID=UPI0015A30A3C|nr:FAD-binding protein [Pseudomonas gingeri]NWA05979.1 FAD-binding protein [Pseudomonas gingeri]